MSIIRCYDCGCISTEPVTIEHKYGDIELCEACAVKRADKAEAEEFEADQCIFEQEIQEQNKAFGGKK